MSVMLQAFYWDSPSKENRVGEWWNLVSEQIEALRKTRFNSIWPPPVSKAASVTSMGYDPYDYFDLGDMTRKTV
jgi:alpha-amylase